MRKISRVIVVHENSLLVIHRNNHGSLYATVPGGGVEPGETPAQAATREVYEETSVAVNIERLLYTWQDDTFGAQQCFLGIYKNGIPQVHPGSTEAQDNKIGVNTFRADWLPLEKLPSTRLLPENLKAALMQDLPKFKSEPRDISNLV